jgi:hypothetical protein
MPRCKRGRAHWLRAGLRDPATTPLASSVLFLVFYFLTPTPPWYRPDRALNSAPTPPPTLRVIGGL